MSRQTTLHYPETSHDHDWLRRLLRAAGATIRSRLERLFSDPMPRQRRLGAWERLASFHVDE